MSKEATLRRLLRHITEQHQKAEQAAYDKRMDRQVYEHNHPMGGEDSGEQHVVQRRNSLKRMEERAAAKMNELCEWQEALIMAIDGP